MTYFRNVEGENIYCIRQITTKKIKGKYDKILYRKNISED